MAVTITENICVSDGKSTGLKSSASTPYLGQRKSYTIQISNEMLGMPSLVAGALSMAAKNKAAEIAANAIAAKLGANFLPGLNVVSWILSAGAMVNALTGKAGIAITIELEYTERYWHREECYTRGWNTVGLSVSRY